jgi:hypothetical protein
MGYGGLKRNMGWEEKFSKEIGAAKEKITRPK